MALAHEYWLKYLITTVGYNYTQIRTACNLYELVIPDRQYVHDLRDELATTRPKPYRKGSDAARSWLRSQKLLAISQNDKWVQRARDFLGDVKLRAVLEALIIADTPREDIPSYCLTLCGVSPPAKAIAYFEHYFWNPSVMRLTHWKEQLDDHPRKDILIRCRERGHVFALWQLGFRQEVAKDDILKGVLHEATMRYFDISGKQNNRDTAATAKLWSDTIFRAMEEMERSGDGMQQVIEELRAISIRLDETDIKPASEVTGGNDSLSKKKNAP